MDSLYLKMLPVFFVVSGLVKAVPVTVGWALGRTRLAERFRVYRRSLAPGQLRSEARAAVGVVLCDALLITAFRAAFERQIAPFSLGASLLTFAWMFVGFEVWFYVSHRLLHTRALYRFHAQHHVAQVTDPLTSLSFSMVERLVLMGGGFGLVILAMQVMPVTQVGIMAYILTNYALNVFGHGNTEWLPERFVASPAGRLFFTPTFHALHHARYQGHYGLFTPILDRWLGTAFDDYAEVHGLARRGLGLERIGERVRSAKQPASLVPTPTSTTGTA
ncbi:sterol desaturase family protein [Pyxidicoccus xibeiensis]|uniref:sterol desaturase family protein n=1 Tax=Pyxidicoccus xibeiensis TaxID=2906759 RepID=UPI0020A74F12|nr:sterol desaturase family protein [Pyxidicoccus xibeiensis]MCP3138892.1 sterol desaturase family protein [Pyxidicoccus xibeiensis]